MEAVRQKATRITPRTCLWPLAGSLVLTFGLSIGLTFRSDHHCYAGTCGEWLFPLQARLHVVVWYAWLSASATFLSVRAFHPELQRFLARPVLHMRLPFIGKDVSRGGLLMVSWVVSLYGIIVGIWWIRLHDYFSERNAVGGIFKGSNRLAAVALTGHFCDVTMGMVLLPISRHSALASFFKISMSSTYTIHILAAYTLFSLVIIHGLLYASWVPVFHSLSSRLRLVMPVLNPTYLHNEVWPGNTSSLGVWRASLIFTGSLTALIMAALFVTTLPRIRARNFNLFYFTHLLSIPMTIIICLHASTMFYCTAPGLVMWLLDWWMRLHELRRSLDGTISALGNGWFCIMLPLPRDRLAGCSCRSPLAHFYIHHASSSLRELHPFTTITHLASKSEATAGSDDLLIQFLFRRQGRPDTDTTPIPFYRRLLRGKRQRQQSIQWTAKLSAEANDKSDMERRPSAEILEKLKADETHECSVAMSLRLEGPYFLAVDPYRYQTVVCMVAGTGITGALAIAAAYNHAGAQKPSTQRRWCKCVILWSVKATEDIDLPFLEPMSTGLSLHKFLTGEGRKRADLHRELQTEVDGNTWVYISGPKAFVAKAKEACKSVEQKEQLDHFEAT